MKKVKVNEIVSKYFRNTNDMKKPKNASPKASNVEIFWSFFLELHLCPYDCDTQ